MSIWYVGAMVVAGAYTMFSQYQQGKAQEKMYQAQADQARQEAIIAQQQADAQAELIQDKGKEESKILRRQQMKFLANQQAHLAAMGISGVSASDIIADTLTVQNMDKATLQWNTDQGAWEAKTQGTYQAWQSNNNAAMSDAAKYNTRKATNMNMTSTFLTTAASVTGSFSKVGTTPKGGTNIGGGTTSHGIKVPSRVAF